MKIKNNQKGFTLVELLAVIVILALIMSIAIVSMSGIMQSARQSTFKETALQIINGVRNQLTLANETNPGDAAFASANGVDYYFTSDIIEKGGTTAPLGGTIQYISAPETSGANIGKSNVVNSGTATFVTMKKIGTIGVYRAASNGTCAATSNSFVRVKHNGTNWVYSICLSAGSGYKRIHVTNGTETKLLDNNDTSMIL